MSAQTTIYDALAGIRLIDPHSHINPHAPAASTLADLLGYHYYTELAHSAGMPKSLIEAPGIAPRQLVQRLVEHLTPLTNTAQYHWLIEIARRFFDFSDRQLDTSNWESLYDAAEAKMASAQWPSSVLEQSGVDAVFLTNDFDDPLTGFDTDVYIPCLRTDDLVFHLDRTETRQRLAAATDIEPDSLSNLRAGLNARFRHFIRSGARACAISLPPGFSPRPVSDNRAAVALDNVLSKGSAADPADRDALSRRVFWTLAELCDQYGLPFDLMIGVHRGVYADGVYQGRDLYDSRVSLVQYRELFNRFADVKFPISVLASVTNQELVSHAWIFPNVITNGHWWYSNTPSFIARDAQARLEAVPRNKQIGYYSDAYKLEFIWPKFDMYRRELAKILAGHFVGENGWSEEQAVDLGRQILRGNVEEIFPPVALPAEQEPESSPAKFAPLEMENSSSIPIAVAAESVSEDDEFPVLDLDVELDPPLLDAEIMDDAEQPNQQPAAFDLMDDSELEPLDVGDLTGGDELDDEPPQIASLTGDTEVVPDDEDLKLKSDPTTGEWTFPTSDP